MIESTANDKLDRITSTAQLGSLLRRLRGNKTQQNIVDHARRDNFYLHRPDLSAIERGRRLLTANELRGILHGCGYIELFDSLEGIRRQLVAELSDPRTSNAQTSPVRDQPTVSSGVAQEAQLRFRSSARSVRLNLAGMVSIVFAAVIITMVMLVVNSRAGNTSDPLELDPTAAAEAARKVPLCAEGLVPDPGVTPAVLAQDIGPADAVVPNRLVELRTYDDPQYGWIAWAHLAQSASQLDQLWLDWSYLPKPTERSQWRQCGPHPISSGPDSPAVRAVDSEQRERWFRACGQAPPEDRTPGSTRTSFCTSWAPASLKPPAGS